MRTIYSIVPLNVGIHIGEVFSEIMIPKHICAFSGVLVSTSPTIGLFLALLAMAVLTVSSFHPDSLKAHLKAHSQVWECIKTA